MRSDYHILEPIIAGLLLGTLLGISIGFAVYLQEIAYDSWSAIFLRVISSYGIIMSIFVTYLITMALIDKRFRHTQSETWGQIN